MKRVRVLIPFHMLATDTDHDPGEVIEVSEEQLTKIRAVNVNMVEVMGEVEEATPVEDEPTIDEPVEVEKPKKRKSKKQ